jgi:ABC-type dipeptide/oligopeptide/nickel transport system permease subunit
MLRQHSAPPGRKRLNRISGMKVRLWVAVLTAFLALSVGAWLGWTVHSVAGYDACLDRIDYDKTLYHLCDRG